LWIRVKFRILNIPDLYEVFVYSDFFNFGLPILYSCDILIEKNYFLELRKSNKRRIQKIINLGKVFGEISLGWLEGKSPVSCHSLE